MGSIEGRSRKVVHKEFRIDSFHDKSHKIFYFDTKKEAVSYGKKLRKGNIVFLLRHVIDGKYEVVQEIK